MKIGHILGLIASVCLLALTIAMVPTKRSEHRRAPLIAASTMDGRILDQDYYTGKVTVITFMYIGCPGCMYELPLINALPSKLKNPAFQVLCVAPHTAQQVLEFNRGDDSKYGSIRRHYKVDPIEVPIVAACTETSITDPNVVAPECDFITDDFRVRFFPKTFFIDQQGDIREVYNGYDARVPDSVQLDRWVEKLLALLAEK